MNIIARKRHLEKTYIRENINIIDKITTKDMYLSDVMVVTFYKGINKYAFVIKDRMGKNTNKIIELNEMLCNEEYSDKNITVISSDNCNRNHFKSGFKIIDEFIEKS